MRKLVLILMATILLLALGCGGENKQTYICYTGETVDDLTECPTPDFPPEETIEPITIETTEEVVEEEIEEEPVSYELSSSELDLIKSKLTKNTAVMLSRSMLTNVAPGDVSVLAIGITNTRSKGHNFTVSVEFQQALSSSRSTINGLDPSYLEKWVSMNVYSTFYMESSDQIYLPLIIEIGGEMATSEEIIPGTYTFDVFVDYVDEEGFSKPIVEPNVELSVIIS